MVSDDGSEEPSEEEEDRKVDIVKQPISLQEVLEHPLKSLKDIGLA